MQIGLITSAMDYSSAGISSYIRNLIENLRSIDYENHYCLIHHEKNKNPIYQQQEEVIIPYPRIPFRKTIGENLYLSMKLLKYDYDVIHELAQRGSFYFDNNAKKVLTIHDLTPFILPETHNFFNVLSHRIFLSRSVKNADKVIAISKCTKNDIIKYLKVPEKKISVVYNGIDHLIKVHNRKELLAIKAVYNLPDEFILFVGSIEPRKNLGNLFKSFFRIKKKYPLIKLVIVGKKGWKYYNICKMVEELNLTNEVIFLNYVPLSDLSSIYNLALIFVYPSLYEGFGLPVLEAMACGTPVITSNTSSLPEIVDDAGIMINPYSDKELSDAIIFLISNEEMRSELIRRGFERAKLFSWIKSAQETKKIYEEVI
jgi:glycosyltransferase involved in cell wall biosynthesis